MKVKICGITNLSDALLCEKLGANALGFIFHPKSKRYIESDKAKRIIKKLSPFTLKIGVFVNQSAKEINKISSITGLSAVQLHGDEKINFIEKINMPVIKAFRVSENFNFISLAKYKNLLWLLDSYSTNEYGGTGKKFDWDKIPISLRKNVVLAGGISAENIEYIAKIIKPYAVDVSSSLEKRPGKKDENKLQEFFNKINSFNNTHLHNQNLINFTNT